MKFYVFLSVLLILNTGCQFLAAKHFKQKNRNPTLSQQNELELHKAVNSDDIKKVQELIADGVNVNFKNKAGQAPLDLVSQVIITKDEFSIFKVNALEIATALIKAGAKVSKTSKLHSQLLLHVISIQRVVYSPQASGRLLWP